MILGITGFAGSGKDTFAQPFIASGWTQLRFADPLKAMLRALLRDAAVYDGLIDEMLEGNSKEIPFTILGGQTPRFAMQTLGTEWRNMLSPKLWTLHMEAKLEKLRGNAIITDVRFPHEVECLRQFGAYIIKIQRPGRKETGHESEQHIRSIQADMEILNDGTKEWFQEEARRVLAFLSGTEMQ